MKKNNIDKNIKVLSVKNLRKYFRVGSGSKSLLVPAIDDISFDIYKGEVFGLVGESGCGKTTTGRTIIKLYSPTDGTIDFSTTNEDGEIENVRIGSGYSGNIHRINKAKKVYFVNSLQYKPYANKKNIINKNFRIKSKELRNSSGEIKNQIKAEKQVIISSYTNYKNDLYENYQKYVLTLDDIKFDSYSEILKLYSENQENSLKELRHQLKFNKENFKIKRGAIKDSAGLTKDEMIASQQLNYNNFQLEHDRLTALLNEAKNNNNVDKNAKIKTNEQKKSVITQRNIKLDELKQNFKNNKLDIKSKYLLEIFKDNTGVSFKGNMKLLFSKIYLEIKSSKNLKELKKSLRTNKKEKVSNYFKRVKELIGLFFDRIKNRKNYVNNKEALLLEKQNLNQTINAEKEAINNLKASNKLKNSSHVLTKIQMIFQDPIESLNPRMTVKEIVAEGLIVQGVTDEEYLNKKVVNILELVGLSSSYLSRYPHEFSGGQRQRIGIARALIMEPEFIIADEPVSALDVSIQAQVINLLNELKDKLGLTILFIAHDLSVVKYFTDRIAVMNRGKIVELSDTEELFNNPIHPYTKSLLSAVPQPDPQSEATRTRVSYSMDIHDYVNESPEMVEVKENHFIYANKTEIKEWTKGVEK